MKAAAIWWCAASFVGCASWQGPRIDPSGERLFVWPNQAPPTIVAPPPGAPVITGPPVVGPPVVSGGSVPPPFSTPIAAPTPIVGAPFGNVQAPPVYSDPAGAIPTSAPPAMNPYAPNVIAPPSAVVAPAPTTAIVPAPTSPTVQPAGCPGVATACGAPPTGVEQLRLVPNGVMAPIGSEVVIRAAILSCDGQLVANRRVDWGVSGVGQVSELGTPEQLGYFRWPWDVPRKINNAYAIGSTANVETVLYRGTPDPNDDVRIQRGDSWVTVTSPCEGTSLVTAYTPSLENYNRVTTTVYWVDAQFVFPPPSAAEPGRPHTLTTTVLRRSDGAPLPGWTVRYDVAGGASLGYEGGNFVEATTDAAGRASVEVSPVNAGGGTTNVGVTVIRPAGGALGAAPLPLGRGSTTITWGAGGVAIPGGSVPPAMPNSSAPTLDPYTPMPTSPGTTFQPPTIPSQSSPPPSLPSNQPPAANNPYTPPANEPTVARPRLDLQLRRTGPEQVGVGGFTRFEVIITNNGEGTARGIVVEAQFDRGLRHEMAKPNDFSIRYQRTNTNPGVRDLPPGESDSVPLTFQVVGDGTQCTQVTVTADGAEPAVQRTCVTATKPALEITVVGPRSRVVGDSAPFNITVKNRGDVSASNVQVIVRLDPALEPTSIDDQTHQRLPDGTIALKMDRPIGPSEMRKFEIMTRCRSQSDNACARADMTADGGFADAAEDCVEILPALPAEAGGILGP